MIVQSLFKMSTNKNDVMNEFLLFVDVDMFNITILPLYSYVKITDNKIYLSFKKIQSYLNKSFIRLMSIFISSSISFTHFNK